MPTSPKDITRGDLPYLVSPVFKTDRSHRSLNSSLRVAISKARGLRSQGIPCLVIDRWALVALDEQGFPSLHSTDRIGMVAELDGLPAEYRLA